MEFLTEEQVAAEAQKGKLPAMECSLKHHKQGRDAGKMELIKATEESKFGIHSELCACCVENSGECPKCVFGEGNFAQIHCCKDNWNPACDAFNKFQADYSNANFKAFQDAEAKLCEYIEGKIREEKRKIDKKLCHNCYYDHAIGPCKSCKSCKSHSNWVTKATPKAPIPKLKHGDYGTVSDSFIYLDGKVHWLGLIGEPATITNPDNSAHARLTPRVIGNLLAGLKHNSEDLEEFNMDNLDHPIDQELGAHVSGDRKGICITFLSIIPVIRCTPDETIEFAKSLIQTACTAKRKQAKKSK